MIDKQEKSLLRALYDVAYDRLVGRAVSDKPINPQVMNGGFFEFSSPISGETVTTHDKQVDIDYNLGLNTDWCWKTFDIRSSEIAKYDWDLVHVMDEENKKVVKSHPGIDLFYDVNDEYTEIDLWKQLQLSYDVLGESFWYMVLDPVFNRPTSIIPLLPDMGKVYIYKDDYGKILKYELRPRQSAKSIFFDPHEIFYYKCFDLVSSGRGLGLMNKLIRLAKIDRGLKDYMRAFLENYGSASIHMSVDKPLSDENYKVAKKRFKDEWAGSRRYRQPIFTDLGTKIEEIGQTVKELDFANSNTNIRDQIIAIAGTQSYLYGIRGATTKADVEGQKLAWLENTVFPLLEIRDSRFSQDFWNKYYPQKEGKGGKLQMVTRKPKLDDAVVEMELDKKRMGMGLMTVDQMCIKQGLPPVGGTVGAKRFISTDLIELKENQSDISLALQRLYLPVNQPKPLLTADEARALVGLDGRAPTEEKVQTQQNT